MNPLDQTKAIAELDGKQLRKSNNSERWAWFNYTTGELLSEWHDTENFAINALKYYLTSRDAIIPVILKQSDTMQYNIFLIVTDVAKKEIQFTYQIFKVTPPQLCEALLRATGKWTE